MSQRPFCSLYTHAEDSTRTSQAIDLDQDWRHGHVLLWSLALIFQGPKGLRQTVFRGHRVKRLLVHPFLHSLLPRNYTMVNFVDRLNAKVRWIYQYSCCCLIRELCRSRTPLLGGGSDWRALVTLRSERAPGSQFVHLFWCLCVVSDICVSVDGNPRGSNNMGSYGIHRTSFPLNGHGEHRVTAYRYRSTLQLSLTRVARVYAQLPTFVSRTTCTSPASLKYAGN